LFLVPRPIYIEGVELAGDNSKVSLLLLPIFQQVIPSLPVYYYKGDFFNPLDGAIEAAMTNFFATHRVAIHKDTGEFAQDTYDPENGDDKGNKEEHYRELYDPSPLTYYYWIQLKKTEGSPIEDHLRSLNATQGYYQQLTNNPNMRRLAENLDSLTHGIYTRSSREGGDAATKVFNEIPSGIIPRFGFALISFRVVDWVAHGDTEELSRALLQKQTEMHRAAGVREEAYGRRDANIANGKGERSRNENNIKSLTENGVSPDMAARFLETSIRTENLGKTGITTYVEGGGSSSSIMVPASSPSSQNKTQKEGDDNTA
ncbi:MAG: hypothetical protein ACQEP6_01170, partial [Patescibacteria group bacterium]